MCTPLSVSTMPESSPTLSAKAASSNGFCMAPRLNGPRSPPCFALLQSLSTDARAGKEWKKEEETKREIVVALMHMRALVMGVKQCPCRWKMPAALLSPAKPPFFHKNKKG